jgi:hypothetical protein
MDEERRGAEKTIRALEGNAAGGDTTFIIMEGGIRLSNLKVPSQCSFVLSVKVGCK